MFQFTHRAAISAESTLTLVRLPGRFMAPGPGGEEIPCAALIDGVICDLEDGSGCPPYVRRQMSDLEPATSAPASVFAAVARIFPDHEPTPETLAQIAGVEWAERERAAAIGASFAAWPWDAADDPRPGWDLERLWGEP